MALTIGVPPGGDVYFNDVRVTVEHVTHALNFKVKVHGISMDHMFTITDQKATEIMPHVMVSAGHNGNPDMVKLAIEAPRSIKVLRGKLYREDHSDVQN